MTKLVDAIGFASSDVASRLAVLDLKARRRVVKNEWNDGNANQRSESSCVYYRARKGVTSIY